MSCAGNVKSGAGLSYVNHVFHLFFSGFMSVYFDVSMRSSDILPTVLMVASWSVSIVRDQLTMPTACCSAIAAKQRL